MVRRGAYGLLLACALAMPAMAGAFSTSASMVDTGGCINQTAGGTGIATAGISVAPPESCSGGYTIYGGATALSSGLLSAAAEYTGGPFASSMTLTSTASLTDTLTFSCGSPTCGPADLTATLDGGFLGFLSPGGFTNANSYSVYTATISDAAESYSVSNTTEFCPHPPGTNCTVSSASAANPLAVTLPFTIYSGDSYTVQISITAFVQLVSGVGGQELASMNDPLVLTLPNGVNYASASGQFAAPEPSSWLLAGPGLLALLGTAKRRLARK